MNKIKYLLPLLGLAFATGVFAYFGSHNFTSVNVSSSDGHSYKADFVGRGNFPFNGAGLFDRSKVNLKGTLTVSEKDGVPASESTCFAMNGTLKESGGTVKITQYTDTSCAVVAKRTTYYADSYAESGAGNFSAVVHDAAGIVYTLTGSHGYQP